MGWVVSFFGGVLLVAAFTYGPGSGNPHDTFDTGHIFAAVIGLVLVLAGMVYNFIRGD